MSDKKSKSKLCLLLSTAVIGGCLSTSYLFAADSENPATGRSTHVNPTAQSLPGLTGVELSPEEKTRLETICQKMTEAYSRVNQIAGKDIVVFLGRTGAGKSTAINFLDSRIRLTTAKSKIILDPNFAQENAQHNALDIGIGRQSETLYPAPHEMQDGTFFVDLPGFMDTRGPDLNLITSAFIKRILESAARIKFVFVMGADQLTREGTANETFSQIEKIYGSHLYRKMLQTNSIFLLTKSDEETEDDVNDILKDDKHPLYSYDQNKICYIPKPSGGNLDANKRTDILRKISECRYSEEHNRGFNVNEIVPRNAQDLVDRFFYVSMYQLKEEKIKALSPNPDSTLVELYNLFDRCNCFFSEWQQAFEQLPVVRMLKPFSSKDRYEQNAENFKRDLQEVLEEKKKIIMQMRNEKHRKIFEDILTETKNTVSNAERAAFQLDDSSALTVYSNHVIQRMITELNNWTAGAFKEKLTQKIKHLASEHKDIREAQVHDPVAQQSMSKWRDEFLTDDAKNGAGELTRLLRERKDKLKTEEGRRRDIAEANARTAAAQQAAAQDRRERDEASQRERAALQAQVAAEQRERAALQAQVAAEQRAREALEAQVAVAQEKTAVEQRAHEALEAQVAAVRIKAARRAGNSINVVARAGCCGTALMNAVISDPSNRTRSLPNAEIVFRLARINDADTSNIISQLSQWDCNTVLNFRDSGINNENRQRIIRAIANIMNFLNRPICIW